MRNVEIKARVKDVDGFGAKLKALKPGRARVVVQEDVFFNVTRGRLKLRVLGPKSGELIFYDRPDQKDPKVSDYEVVRTLQPSRLRDVLAASLGVRGRVRKVRMIAKAGRTRIHLDDVAGLGLFTELEVVLGPRESTRAGETIARDFMKKLGIRPSDLVRGAYIDLLEKAAKRRS